MKRGSTLFLKLAIIFIATTVLLWLIWFPRLEGRAVNLNLISIYTDPLIIYSYFASTPFFVGLHQAFKLLNLIDANRAFSPAAMNTLRNIKLASISLIVLIVLAVFYIRFFVHGDDPAGPTMLGICLSFAFAVVATAADILQKLLQQSLLHKS